YGDDGACGWVCEAYDGMSGECRRDHGTTHGRTYHGTRVIQLNAPAYAVRPRDPAGIDQPDPDISLAYFPAQQRGIFKGVQGQECLPETSGKYRLRLGDAHFRSGDLGGVARHEMVHGLGAVKQ